MAVEVMAVEVIAGEVPAVEVTAGEVPAVEVTAGEVPQNFQTPPSTFADYVSFNY